MGVDAREAVKSIPGQLTSPIEIDGVTPLDADRILFCGMGGSGAGADGIAAAHAMGLGPQIAVWKRDKLPSWCGKDSVVIVVSCSGNTAETLAVADQALDVGATVIAVTQGGELGGKGLPTVRIADTGLPPRYSVGALLAGCVAALQAAELTSIDSEWRHRASADLDGVTQVDASKIAEVMHNRVPHLFSASAVAEAAARRWRSDLAENAKVWSVDHPIPEMNHNDIVGLAADGSVNRPGGESMAIVLLSEDESDQDLKRLRNTMRLCGGTFAETLEIRIGGPEPLTRWLALTMLGGAATVELAHLRGVDPVAIDAIDSLKNSLTEDS